MRLLHNKEKQNKNNDQLFRLMTPMIAGILVCVFCLVSMTWAWFTSTVNTGSQTIQSATRSTSVMVYEISQSKDENGNDVKTKTLIKPYEDGNKTSQADISAEDAKINKDASVVDAGESVVWELSPEKSYEVKMTGSGTASTGYCKVALSHTASGSDTAETKLYQTSVFEKGNTVKFTYNTGGFSDIEGVTETEYIEYIEKTTPPTLTISSYWGKPAEDEDAQVSLMSARSTTKEKIMLLSDGDVVGLAPIPCPEAKAETEIELEGFEIQDGEVISAEEDYKISLTLKEGYEMPSEVVVNIDGKDYIVSTQGDKTSEDAPYYDAEKGVLTVPSALLSDGITVSVKATATQVPEEPEAEEPEVEETEEEKEEEKEEETTDETTGETEETTDKDESEENKSSDTSSGNSIVADNPAKKEEDGEQSSDEPAKIPAGDGDDDGDDEDDENTENSSTGNTPSDDGGEKTEEEKADVTLNLSQLTINLEETQIPTNADLVLTLSAKEDMELPESIVITLDKTICDENINEEEIEENKTEYIINTNGNDNPDGFEFNAESGELTISSELLEGVREIIIADTEENETNEDEDKATLTFEVKNLTFDFADDEIVTDEDVVITFTAGEGYELPETIMITIDGVEYIIYTSDENSGKNPEGIVFNTETGTLIISKDLLEDIKEITITAEGVEKTDDEENPDAGNNNESEDKDTTGKENEGETDVPTVDDKAENENGTDSPAADDKKESGTESGDNGEAPDESGESDTEPTTPAEPSEPDTDPTTPAEPSKPDTEPTTPAEPSEPDTEPTTPAEPSEPDTDPTTPAEPNEPGTDTTTDNTEDNTNAEQGDESVKTEEPTPTPDTESDNSQSSAETDAPVVVPETTITETSSASESEKNENSGDGGVTPTTPAISVPAASTTTLESKETSSNE